MYTDLALKTETLTNALRASSKLDLVSHYYYTRKTNIFL